VGVMGHAPAHRNRRLGLAASVTLLGWLPIVVVLTQAGFTDLDHRVEEEDLP
jgi:hypothetical protein